MKNILLFLLPLLAIVACDSGNNAMYNDLVEPAHEGVFRGIHFNMDRASVYELETMRSTVSVYSDEESDELVITTDMGPEILDFADVTYNFDEQGLYAISVESYNEKFSEVTAVYDLFVKNYGEKYGAGTMADDGFMEFEGVDEESGENFSIAIKNIDDVEDSYGLYIYFDVL